MRVFLNGTEFEARDYKTYPSPDGLELQFRFGLNEGQYLMVVHLEDLVIPVNFETFAIVGTRLLIPSPGDDLGWSQTFNNSGHRNFVYYLLDRRLQLNPLGSDNQYAVTFLGECFNFSSPSLREAQAKAIDLAADDLRQLASRAAELRPTDNPASSRFDLIG